MDLQQQLDCTQCGLKEKCVGAGISAATSLGEGANQNRVYQRGEKISNLDNTPGVLLLRGGLMRVLRRLPAGAIATIDLLSSHDMFIYPSLYSLSDSKRMVEFLEKTELCFIPLTGFTEWLKQSKSARDRLIRWVGQEFLRREEQICSLSHRSVRERTAEALLFLSEKFGEAHALGKTIPSSLTREDIAALIGTARESVVRQLAELKEESAIALEGRQIIVCNRELLYKIGRMDACKSG